MRTRNKELEMFRKKARELVAQYMRSEGCSCCEGPDHKEHGQMLGEFLNMKKYSDSSGIDYNKYLPKPKSK